MRSAWFWGTDMWAQYETAYYTGKVRPDEYKSSPLADDHEFSWDAKRGDYDLAVHQTQILRLDKPMIEVFSGLRHSYRSIIHRANDRYVVYQDPWFARYKALHIAANGRQPRPDETYAIQEKWLADGHGLLVGMGPAAMDAVSYRAFAYWIIYQGCAYYMSGPSVEPNVQHAVICNSLELLKARRVWKVELGQIDGETEKERNIGKFKCGFGGKTVPFTIATRRAP